MKFSINNRVIYVFKRIAKLFGKCSNEMFIEATATELQIKTFNSSQTCILKACFKKSYFTEYDSPTDKDLIKDDNDFSCKAPTKYFLNAIKTAKAAEYIISLDNSVNNERLVVDIVKENGVIVTNEMQLLDDDELFSDPFASTKETYSILKSHPAVFHRVLQNSSKEIREFNILFDEDHVVIKSFSDAPDEDFDYIKFEYRIDANEFRDYDVQRKASLIINSQDFIRMIQLALSLEKYELQIKFASSGRPLIMTIDNNHSVSLSMMISSQSGKSNKRRAKNSYKQLMQDKYINNKSQHQAQGNKTFTDTGVLRAINPDVFQFNSEELETRRDQNVANVSKQISIKPTESLSFLSDEINEEATSTQNKSRKQKSIEEVPPESLSLLGAAIHEVTTSNQRKSIEEVPSESLSLLGAAIHEVTTSNQRKSIENSENLSLLAAEINEVTTSTQNKSRKRKSTEVPPENSSTSRVEISQPTFLTQKKPRFDLEQLSQTLNKAELSEVQDIMDDLESDFDFGEDLPPSQNNLNNNENLKTPLITTTTTMYNSNLQNSSGVLRGIENSHRPMGKSFWQGLEVNTEDVGPSVTQFGDSNISNRQFNDSTTVNPSSSNGSNNHGIPTKVDSRFTTLFKRHDNATKFGKIILEGSESEEDV